MKKTFFQTLIFIGLLFLIQCNGASEKDSITFYSVPLVCGADSNIGCGSRIKPLFLETEKQNRIKES